MRKKVLTAHEKIKRWLLKGKSISGYIAWQRFSCYRLSSVIHRLRKKDKLNIEMKLVCPGKDYSFAQYSIPKSKAHGKV